ncbi:hypothetical protein HID58_075144, partial [Brassica napus]
CSRIVTLPPVGLGTTPISPWVIWNLWTNRNKLLFDDKEYTIDETVSDVASEIGTIKREVEEDNTEPKSKKIRLISD